MLDSLSHDTFAISEDRPDKQFLSRCCVVSQSDPGSTESLAVAQKLIISTPSSPAVVFVDRSADLRLAARCTVTARFGFSASSSSAPGAVFVHEAVEKAFSAHLVESLRAFLANRDGVKQSQLEDQVPKNRKNRQSQKEATGTEVLFSSASVEVIGVRDR